MSIYSRMSPYRKGGDSMRPVMRHGANVRETGTDLLTPLRRLLAHQVRAGNEDIAVRTVRQIWRFHLRFNSGFWER